MAAKKSLINSPDTLVVEAIEGFVACHAHLARLDGFPEIKVVVDAMHDKSKVAVVSGGGSGHEPAMAGYVGCGMLAAAVCGEVFASPSEDAVLAAIRAVTGPAGCLLVVMNYTGDRLNFGAAAERAKAEGLRVEMVIVADDCALASKQAVGRRGIAGTVLVHKMAGAAAASGASLQAVKAAAEAAADNIGTMGASLTDCTIFGHAPAGRLGPDELEMGLGIHGEPGAYREKVRPLSGIIDELISRIAAGGDCYLPVARGQHVVLLVNNLGSTTPLEMNAAANAAVQLVHSQLKATLERLYCGHYMTSLDMHGLSVTLLRVPDDSMLQLLDAPCQAPAWPSSPAAHSSSKQPLPVPTGSTDAAAAAAAGGGGAAVAGSSGGEGGSSVEGQTARRCLEAACQTVLAAEAELNALDGKVGDGDCGSTLSKGAAAIQQLLPSLPLADPAAAALMLAAAMGRSMGGTSGAIYKIMLTAIAASLKQQEQQWAMAAVAAALLDGAAAVSKYGGAQQGSRTMLDALVPAAQALSDAAVAGQPGPEAAAAAAAAAAAGAEATKDMQASAGRSSYVPAGALAGVADPGAVAVATWLGAIAKVL